MYKYAVGEEVSYGGEKWRVLSRKVVGEYNIYEIKRLSDGWVIDQFEHNLSLIVAAPIPAPIPRDPDETIPGDRDADYPVTEKDAMSVFVPFAVAAVVMYVFAKLLWK